MRILSLHCDHFGFTLDHPATPAADVTNQKVQKFSDSIVALIAVEKKDTESTLAEVVKYLPAHAGHLGVSRVILNSFVHLTSDPAPIAKAKSLLTQLAATLSGTGLKVELAPFGWHKKFDFSVTAEDGSQSYREF